MDRAELDRMRELTLGLNVTEERMARLRSRAERVTALLDGLPHGSLRRSIVEESLTRIMAELDAAAAMISELSGLRMAFEVQLSGAEMSDRERLIMRLRYLDGLSWRRIGALMVVSDGWLFKMHRRAVKKFYASDQ